MKEKVSDQKPGKQKCPTESEAFLRTEYKYNLLMMFTAAWRNAINPGGQRVRNLHSRAKNISINMREHNASVGNSMIPCACWVHVTGNATPIVPII